MKRIALAVFSALALAGAASIHPGTAASDDEQPGFVRVDLSNCLGTRDARPVLLADAESYVPDRYRVDTVATAAPPPPAWLGPPDARVVEFGFNDLVCESVSVAGHEPQPTIVSFGYARVTRDDIRTTYYLWIGTDNPLLFARLRALGVVAYFIPHSSYSETTNALGQRVITVNHVDEGPADLNYTRTITVVSEPTIPVGGPGKAYQLGSRGEVAFTFDNHDQLSGRANVCFDAPEGSLPTRYGITNFQSLCFPTVRTFFIGDIGLEIERLP